MASPSSYGPRVDLMALQLYHGRRVYPTPITARVLGRPRRQGGLSYAVILAGKEISKACLLSKPGVPTPGTPSNRSRSTAALTQSFEIQRDPLGPGRWPCVYTHSCIGGGVCPIFQKSSKIPGLREWTHLTRLDNGKERIGSEANSPGVKSFTEN